MEATPAARDHSPRDPAEPVEDEPKATVFDLIEYVEENKNDFEQQFQELLAEAEKKKLEKNRTLIQSSFQMVMAKYLEDPQNVNFVEVASADNAGESIRHLLSINFEFDVPEKLRIQKFKTNFKSEVERELVKWVKLDLYSSDRDFKKTIMEKTYFSTNTRKITTGNIPKTLPRGLEQILNYLDYTFLAEGLFSISQGFLRNDKIRREGAVHDDFFLFVKIADIKYNSKPVVDMAEDEVRDLVTRLVQAVEGPEAALDPVNARFSQKRSRPTSASGRASTKRRWKCTRRSNRSSGN